MFHGLAIVLMQHQSRKRNRLIFKGFGEHLSGNLAAMHLSLHGDGEGIVFSSGERLTWAELKELLVPINRATSGNLLLCMSSESESNEENLKKFKNPE
jgi:hypothetical protein